MDQFNYRNPIVNVKYINVGMKLLNFQFIYVDILMFEKNLPSDTEMYIL